MGESIIFDVQHQIAFSPVIVFYLFAAGMGAGLFILSTLGPVFGMKKMQPLAKPASVMSLAAIVPVLLLLIVDLGQPLRFYTILLRFTPTSVMSWGTFILTFFSIACVLYIYFLWAKKERAAKGAGIAGFVLSVGLAIYTGLAHALWDSTLLTIIFFISGLLAAISLIAVFIAFFPKLAGFNSGDLEEGMSKQLRVWFVGLSIALIGVYAVTMLASDGGSALLSYLLSGDRMIPFVVIQLVLGMVLPLLLLLVSQSKSMMGIAGALSLIGVYLVRHNLMIGGQEILSSGSMLAVPENASHELTLFIIFAILVVVAILFLPKIVDIVLNKFLTAINKNGMDKKQTAS